MKKFFKNNKGFTLVELIIVIAVMAVLTVVVAPQYLKYVEDSRIATDQNAIGELAHIVEISYVEATAAGKDDDLEVKITTNTDGTFAYGTETPTDLDTYVKDVYPVGSYKFKSNLYTDAAVTITFKMDKTTGLCTVTDPKNP